MTVNDKNGYSKIKASRPDDFSLKLTSNDNFGGWKWFTVDVDVGDSAEFNLVPTDEGIVVCGDNLSNITITANNEIDNTTIKFSTSEESVLVKNSEENELEIYADTNDDGTYETIISNGGGLHTHSFGKDWISNSTSHWHECTCGKKSEISQHTENLGVITVEPTATTEGTRTYSCTVCGYVMRTETIPPKDKPHIHSFSTNWKFDSIYHWHECPCGERADTDRHTDNGGIVTVQPTSTTSGTKIHSCPVCGYVIYTETIPALGIIDRPDNPDLPPDVLPMPIFPSDRNNILNKEIELSVRSELTGLSSKGVHIESIRKFFSESAMIRLTETADSKYAAELAMNNFDNEKMICYPFDISVYSTATGEKIQLRHSGYITFEIPVPENMVNISDSIAVYHITGGIPEHIESEIITDTNGNNKIRFTAKKFSPYMFTAETVEDITAEVAANSIFSDLMSPVSNGVTVLAIKLPRTVKWIGKKKKYRVIRKRRINDLIFVF